mgnify:FL=1
MNKTVEKVTAANVTERNLGHELFETRTGIENALVKLWKGRYSTLKKQAIERFIRTLFPGRRETKQMPVYELSSWGATMEFCLDFPEETKAQVRAVFYTFDEETQRALTFSPIEQGEWVERAELWRYALKPTLSKEHYHIAMTTILKWYIHCVKDIRPANTTEAADGI